MKKIFKTRKTYKFKYKKFLKLCIISFFSAFILSRLDIFSNDKFINILKNSSISKIDFKNLNFKGEYLLNIGLNTFDDIKFSKTVFKEETIEKENTKLPIRVYIYNTHQTEEYATIENYNLTPTVLTAAFILKEKLEDLGIGTYVEESDLKTDMQKYGYNYNQTYSVSRKWLENYNNPNLDLYIDLHRDSIDYKYSNVVKDGLDYAKIMFVLGINHEYEENKKTMEGILKGIESTHKEISRGIYDRKAIFNQDYSKNLILIELGGPDSTYESISNSLDVLARAIKDYLG